MITEIDPGDFGPDVVSRCARGLRTATGPQPALRSNKINWAPSRLAAPEVSNPGGLGAPSDKGGVVTTLRDETTHYDDVIAN